MEWSGPEIGRKEEVGFVGVVDGRWGERVEMWSGGMREVAMGKCVRLVFGGMGWGWRGEGGGGDDKYAQWIRRAKLFCGKKRVEMSV